MHGGEYEKARKIAYRYLSYRPRTEYEVGRMLMQKGFDDTIVGRVMENLREYRLLDDREFAGRYVARNLRHPRGVLEERLKRLGITESVAREALEEVDRDTEIRIAIALANGRIKRKGDNCFIGDIAAFLQRRGFDQDVVGRVCNYLENKRQP
ncbi:MAG: regulatory protein RecX [Bacillota bacterium]